MQAYKIDIIGERYDLTLNVHVTTYLKRADLTNEQILLIDCTTSLSS